MTSPGDAPTDASVTALHRAIYRVEGLVSEPGVDEDERRRRSQVVVASVLVVPAGVLWGALYYAFGARVAALFPWAYAALTLADLLVFLRYRRIAFFRITQQFLLWGLPFALQIILGGYVGSSLIIVWVFLAVLLALLFGSRREATIWFVVYILSIMAPALFQPTLAVRNTLPHGVVLAFFVLNIGAVSTIAFLVLRSFVNDRRRLRELEVAYVNQEMTLRQSEKLATLGTLAAGVAHELNNPAAASRRAAEQLEAAFARLEEAQLRLDSSGITPEQRAAWREIARELEESGAKAPLSALARTDLESQIEEWLEEQGIEEAWEMAPALMERGLDPARLSPLASVLQGEPLAALLDWISSGERARQLARQVGDSSTRISQIVGALKGYSFLGQGEVQQVDVHAGIDSTLTILHGRIPEHVTVRRDYGDGVPPLQGEGSELNQVWTNLLANALDALEDRAEGAIVIRTRHAGEWVEVEIEDDGPGIPVEIRPRIFDPFFTTKPPGHGTGLGLSICHTIVTRRHGGELKVESRAGMTRFTVRLPVGAPQRAAQR